MILQAQWRAPAEAGVKPEQFPSESRSATTRKRAQLRHTKMTVEQLEHAVQSLSSEELDSFSEWFEEFLADRWDAQIEQDIAAGKLDDAAAKADEDFEAGRCTPL
jgi:hypothetical protein